MLAQTVVDVTDGDVEGVEFPLVAPLAPFKTLRLLRGVRLPLEHLLATRRVDDKVPLDAGTCVALVIRRGEPYVRIAPLRVLAAHRFKQIGIGHPHRLLEPVVEGLDVAQVEFAHLFHHGLLRELAGRPTSAALPTATAGVAAKPTPLVQLSHRRLREQRACGLLRRLRRLRTRLHQQCIP